MKTYYVLGFAFDEDNSKVALIEKNRPEWQAGLLNGIGGHIEDDENELDAMHREFEEETGVSGLSWQPLAIMDNIRFRVYVYASYGNKLDGKLTTLTSEVVSLFPVDFILARMFTTITNVPWLLTLALDRDMISGRIAAPTITYIEQDSSED